MHINHRLKPWFSNIGTATGFGTSTVMIPVMALFVPLPLALLFVGIIHLCGDIWKVVLFKRGLDWKLILGFGLSGIAASFLGASLSLNVKGMSLKRILGGFLILYVAYLFLKREWVFPKTPSTALRLTANPQRLSALHFVDRRVWVLATCLKWGYFSHKKIFLITK